MIPLNLSIGAKCGAYILFRVFHLPKLKENKKKIKRLKKTPQIEKKSTKRKGKFEIVAGLNVVLLFYSWLLIILPEQRDYA